MTSTLPTAVSVVMPARNAAATIEAQLAALAAQTYDGILEVIVVDNDSDDDTAAIARRWQERIPGLVVTSARERRGVSHARNVGIAGADNDVVLLCDADDVVDRDWVRRLSAALGDAELADGSTVDWDGGPLPRGAPELFGTGGFGFLPAFSGCNVGLRRRVWTDLDGFDESLESCEDIDFAWRAQLAGVELVHEPSAVVFYRVDTRRRAVIRKWIRDAANQPLLYARFREHGLARQRLSRVVARYLVLALTSPHFFSSDEPTRTSWCRELGRRIGRIRGSVRWRSVYL